MDSTDFIRIFPVYILVYMNRINYMHKNEPPLLFTLILNQH